MDTKERCLFVLEEYCQNLQKEAENAKNKHDRPCYIAVVEMLQVFVANMRLNRTSLKGMKFTIEVLLEVFEICERHVQNFEAEKP